MNWNRIKTSALHSWYHLNHSVETWVDLLWFSFIDVLVFGFVSSFFVKDSQSATFLIVGITFWEVVRISQYTITIGVLWEIWARSFTSLFISPLTLWEFLAGQALSGLVKAFAVSTLVSVLAYFVFGFNILALQGWVLIYFIILFLFAIGTGIFLLGMLLRFGTNIQSLAWGLIFLFQPLSALFYPIGALPAIVRPFAYISPISYVMESVRSQLTGGTVLYGMIGIGFCLSLVYVGIGITYARSMLYWGKQTGAFARMGN